MKEDLVIPSGECGMNNSKTEFMGLTVMKNCTPQLSKFCLHLGFPNNSGTLTSRTMKVKLTNGKKGWLFYPFLP